MRHELELELTSAPEIEAADPVVGEIAYDINNLLTVVSGSALRLQARLEFSDAAGDLAQIICASDRAAELTRQLLAVDGEPTALTLVDLAGAICRLEPTIRLLVADDIVLDFRHYQPAPSVLIEPARFEQILMNLIMNASDAMARGGTLTVSTQPRSVSAMQAARRGIAAGSYVLMSVSDTGGGIELEDRIFDPLFTTTSGTATGVRLTSVRGAVDHAGGRIDIDSEPSRGTTFRVLLPGAPGTSRTDLAIGDSATRGTSVLGKPFTPTDLIERVGQFVSG